MSNFKFKRGDKVKMSSFKYIKFPGGSEISMNKYMKDLVGKEGTVVNVEDYNGPVLYEVRGYMWPQSALTLVEDKEQLNPGDKVNCSDNGEDWTTNELFYVGVNRKGDYVTENDKEVAMNWNYCRLFKEKITYNVWKYNDHDDELLTLIEGKFPLYMERWNIVHTFTI
jgi:hypothetical protein